MTKKAKEIKSIELKHAVAKVGEMNAIQRRFVSSDEIMLIQDQGGVTVLSSRHKRLEKYIPISNIASVESELSEDACDK